jgi:hypothetical protein
LSPEKEPRKLKRLSQVMSCHREQHRIELAHTLQVVFAARPHADLSSFNRGKILPEKPLVASFIKHFESRHIDRGQISKKNSLLVRDLKVRGRSASDPERTPSTPRWGRSRSQGYFGDPIPVITVQLGGSLAGKLSSRLSSTLSLDEFILSVSASRRRLGLEFVDLRRCAVGGLAIMSRASQPRPRASHHPVTSA